MRHATRAVLVVLFAALAPALVPAAVRAGSDIAGLDVMTATVFQQGQSSFSGIGARLALRSARLVQSLEFLPTVEYWRNNSHVTLQSVDLRTTRRDASLGLDARWVFERPTWKPYAGVGLAIHFLDSEADAPALDVHHAHNAVVKGGVAALAGVRFEGPGRLGNFLEAKYHEVPDYRQLKLNMGLSWAF